MTQVAELRPRIALVDFSRVLAVMFMIQGHTLDVLLAPASRDGFLFGFWLFLRGLTAPMFLLLCGFSFAISSLQHWDSYQRFTPKLLRRLRRFVFFILLGYAMHSPVDSFQKLRTLDAAGWESWLQVDVLQCIGVTLVFLQLLILLARTPQRFAKLAISCSAFIVLVAPVVWGIDWTQHLPLSLASYFSARTGSLFPLFPWAGYALLGAALGCLYVRWQSSSGPLPSRILPWAGSVLILAGVCLNEIPVSFYGAYDFWKTSPNLFMIRLGCVCFLLAIFAHLTERIRIPQRLTHSLAQESLAVYSVHVCVLYGSVWNAGLRQRIGPTLELLPTLGWIALMLLSMTVMALAWNWLKRTTPKGCRLARSAAVVLAIAYFM